MYVPVPVDGTGFHTYPLLWRLEEVNLWVVTFVRDKGHRKQSVGQDFLLPSLWHKCPTLHLDHLIPVTT